ncbi:hypothetical protein C6I20_15135 [Aeromicrobium sp. A1-2]|uniref:LuxR C-terminal-related transcriptional regulator n=1 Tax=Aeromicrobium sp. A1-2 TaxID=2107713 RepID=UPI000E4B9D0E|nr:LuxR family transcriptional regulator [Aeromicrobium sp. A1-2]AXT86377.1 hypothetical protein C6I20_15135 [Aeromicrobium sp. A1-2]
MEFTSFSEAIARTTALTRSDESALLIMGESGLGKSHVLNSVLHEPLAHTVLVRANPGESGLPLAGFAALFDAVRGDHSSNFAQEFSLKSEEPSELFAAAQGFLTALRGLNLSPILALVDDIDAMDTASQAVIGMMAGRLHDTGVRLALTATTINPAGPLSTLPVVHLAPMPPDVTVGIVRRHEPAADESSMRIMARYVRGNPQILCEQLPLLQPDQLTGTAWLTLPPRSTPTVARVSPRIAAEDDPVARIVLDAIALSPVSHVAVLGCVHPDAADVIEDLVDSSVLLQSGPYVRLADSRLRIRLYWSQRACVRRQQHVELAAAAVGVDPHLAAWHASFGTIDTDQVEAVLASAIWLVRRRWIGSAVEFTEHALSRAPNIEDHAESLIRLCSHLILTGEVSLAARYSARARPQPSAPKQSMDLAALKLTAQMIDRQMLVDEEAKAIAAFHSQADQDGASNLLTLATFYRAERWEVDEARRLFGSVQDHLPNVSETTREKIRAMSEILDALDGSAGRKGQCTSVTLARTAPSPPDLLLMQGRALTWRERYADARDVFALVINHPDARDRIWTDLATYAAIGNEIDAGMFRLARTAIDAWGQSSPWINRGSAMHALIRAWRHYSLGETDAAATLIDTVLDRASKESTQAVRARAYALRGAMDLLIGDPEQAVTDLRHVSTLSRRFRNPTLLRHWADYVEACVLTDRNQEAAAAVSALERRLAVHNSRWGALALARCRALAQEGPRSLGLFADAVRMFDHAELPYELGRTLLCFADRQDALGRPGDGRQTRLAALTAFEAAGADSWAGHTARPEAAIGRAGERTLLDRLTSDEQEVAKRVMLGLRTKQIADEIYVSVRTVELRLTHMYRTLGVRSRTELVALLSGSLPRDEVTHARPPVRPADNGGGQVPGTIAAMIVPSPLRRPGTGSGSPSRRGP